MSKTIEQIIKERDILANGISTDINNFLKNNPEVSDLDIIKHTYEIETKRGVFKDINIDIKIIVQ